jgi:hypothetical protein
MKDRDYFYIWLLDVVYRFCRGGSRPVRLRLTINTVKGEYLMVTLVEGQKVEFQLVALDSKGRPAPVDGVPVWSNSNPGACDLVLNADELSGEIHYLDGGVAQIRATVDVRIGPEVKELIAIADITCLPPEATVVQLNLGVPEPI